MHTYTVFVRSVSVCTPHSFHPQKTPHATAGRRPFEAVASAPARTISFWLNVSRARRGFLEFRETGTPPRNQYRATVWRKVKGELATDTRPVRFFWRRAPPTRDGLWQQEALL